MKHVDIEMGRLSPNITVRNTRTEDFPAIIDLSRRVYPHDAPWTRDQLASHLRVFPEGQFVAVDTQACKVVGMAASLIIRWEDYNIYENYRTFTADSTFSNHDPTGRTLYAAEVMSDPDRRGEGIGRKLYKARRALVRRLKLRRIRAGARLRGYSGYADQMSAEEYVRRVIHGELIDPTLTFQLRNGFRVLAVVSDYLHDDPDSMGYAAILEWINHDVASKRYYAERDPRFAGRREKAGRRRT